LLRCEPAGRVAPFLGAFTRLRPRPDVVPAPASVRRLSALCGAAGSTAGVHLADLRSRRDSEPRTL